MKKKQFIILLVLSLLGSIIGFFAVNLLMSDISNYAALGIYVVSTFPMFTLFLDIIAIIIGYGRYIKNNSYKKALIKRYSTLILIFSSIGFISSCLTGTIVYGSFLSRFIFPCYGLIMLFIHLIILVLVIYGKLECIKLIKDDKDTKKVSFIYRIYTAFIWFILIYGLNKFGAFLYSPIYITWRLFFTTLPFYLSIALVFVLVAILYLVEVKVIKNAKVLSLVLLICAVVFSLSTIGIGAFNSKMIAAVSTAVPLERLASMPMDSLIVRPLINIGLSLSLFVRARKG